MKTKFSALVTFVPLRFSGQKIRSWRQNRSDARYNCTLVGLLLSSSVYVARISNTTILSWNCLHSQPLQQHFCIGKNISCTVHSSMHTKICVIPYLVMPISKILNHNLIYFYINYYLHIFYIIILYELI